MKKFEVTAGYMIEAFSASPASVLISVITRLYTVHHGLTDSFNRGYLRLSQPGSA